MDKLIFDRTQQDIINKTKKSYYNVDDLIRINDWIKLLSDYLGLGLVIETYSLGQIITLNNINLILDNIQTLKDNWYVANDTPYTPIANGYNYKSANDVEKILSDLNDFMISVESDFKFSGTFYSGEEVIL